MDRSKKIMNYRTAETKDTPNLIELRKLQLIDEGFEPINIIEKELKDYFEKHFFQLPPTFANPSGNIAYITNMFTKNEYRKKGIATDLLKIIIEYSKFRGLKVFRLHTSKQGRVLYEKFGFKELEDHMFLISN